MMTMNSSYEREQTLLTPGETELRFEAWLVGVDHLIEPDRDDVYTVSFQPSTTSDYQRFMEAAEMALMTVELRLGPHSRKRPSKCVEDKRGMCIASQLFKPKLNIMLEHPSLYYGKSVSINGHFRDDPLGNIYFQASYIDLYQDDVQADDATDSPVVIDDW